MAVVDPYIQSIHANGNQLIINLYREHMLDKGGVCSMAFDMSKTNFFLTSRTCGNSTAYVCYLNWKPVDPPPPPPPQQTDGPVGKAGLEL